MLSQENIYQLIFAEQWREVLDLLYKHRLEIKTDPMLQQAAAVFEQEFFTKVEQYPTDRKDIEENLDTLYVLNYGKFYQLSPEGFRALIIEMVKRKSAGDAVAYARQLPNEEICKKIINEVDAKRAKDEGFRTVSPKTIPMNWIEIFNRLFELINNQQDSATYFSGPRFIQTVKEFEIYFPDYQQFIDQRSREGKSTTRKIFYYDILLSLKDETRIRVLNKILDILRPFVTDKVEIIDGLLGKPLSKKPSTHISTAESKHSGNPIVFISYSWDSEPHKQWVLDLADRLCDDGIDVILDRYYLKPGVNLQHFVENSIAEAQRIIIVFTPNYKLKADKRSGGVGYEYSIMNVDLYKNQTSNEKIIPVLRIGNQEDSIPTFMQQYIHLDTRNDENFENSYVDLLREIYNEPAIQKPKVGTKPQFDKKSSEEIEKPAIGTKPEVSDQTAG
jgi:hypothetical protein